MSREDVGRALEAMSDESVLQQIGAGDFSGVEDLDLDADERAILTDAASDYPETQGFALNAYLPNPAAFDFASMGKFGIAAQYALHKPIIDGKGIAGHDM